jgi:hypothetical protein
MIASDGWADQLARDGYAVLRGVFAAAEAAEMATSLGTAVAADEAGDSAIRSDGGAGVVYAARNVLSLWPRAADVWRVAPLRDALAAVLGPGFGLVRVLFFDKPPEATWALPWHKDVTVAVRDNRLPSARFGKPTRKAGVPHVEAPHEVLDRMLTARVHLDDVTEENGPLKVVPGSHHSGTELVLGDGPPHTVFAAAGDVLLMRPLLAHCSGRSQPGTARHRRVLHLEFAASAELLDGYAWHDFVPGSER